MLKKYTSAILAILFVVMSVPSFALQSRSQEVRPSINFDSTHATCSITVIADRTTDAIEVYAELRTDNMPVKVWISSGTGIVRSVETYNAISGKTYTLDVYVSINGVQLPTASTTCICP